MSKSKIYQFFRENRYARTLILPAMILSRKWLVQAYQNSEDSRYMKSLKDIHQGESCFVIGNGPSLRAEDLDRLAEARMICFGTNRIYNIFSQTKWRPTYYLCMDSVVVASELDNIICNGDYTKFVNYMFRREKGKFKGDMHLLCTYSKVSADPFEMTIDTLSDDLSMYGTKTGTVTANAIELAIYMGFKRIYLLGVDNHYAIQRDRDGTIHVDTSIKSSYFNGMNENKALGASIQTISSSKRTYEICKEFAEKHQVYIMNATRGGKLEVFERVDFDELMKKMKKE